MKTKEILYGLLHIEKDKILSYEVISNEGRDFCDEYTYRLCLSGDKEWLHSNPKLVEWARLFKQSWYNSNFDSPVNPYNSDLLKVVEVEIIKEVKEVNIKIPTVYEFFESKYKNKNPQHWASLEKDIETELLNKYDYYYLLES